MTKRSGGKSAQSAKTALVPVRKGPISAEARRDAAAQIRRNLIGGTNWDGYVNMLTGFGDPLRDKTLGGRHGMLHFDVHLPTWNEVQDRWRGSDLGKRIVEVVPGEMIREGWEVSVQPTEDEKGDLGGDGPGSIKVNDEGQRLEEELDRKLIKLKVKQVFKKALEYERGFGGGGVFVGVDDGVDDLTLPLDMSKVRDVTHLTAFRGGWDGEIVGYRPYHDMKKPKYGEVEVYALRNIGVPIMHALAPGEKYNPKFFERNARPPETITYVHESRILAFPGDAVTNWTRWQMRGWGDSIFTHVDEVLSQFGQTWQGVAILMQDFASGTLQIEGLAEILAGADGAETDFIIARARALALGMSLARTRVLDATEKYAREVAPLSGIGDVLDKFMLRLAAAAGMPVALLMGQAPAGLNATGASDIRFFYDQIAGDQETNLQPNLERLIRIVFQSAEGPSEGVEPDRWSVEMRPLYQLTEVEQAEVRYKTAQGDVLYCDRGIITPEEIAASRFGGSKWSMETTLDLEGRARMLARALVQKAQAVTVGKPGAPAGAAPEPAPGAPAPTQQPEKVPAAPAPPQQAREPEPKKEEPDVPKKDTLSNEERFALVTRGLKDAREGGVVLDAEKLREQFPELPVVKVHED